jgi:hypothetical protein
MNALAWALRALAGGAALAAVGAGIAFTRSDGRDPAPAAPAIATQERKATAAATPTPVRPATGDEATAAPSPATDVAPTVTVTPGTRSPAARELATPAATGTATPQPVPPGDLPRFSATDVLDRSADALLPSGITFRACAETFGEAWPLVVHLYYEGNGSWLVETHVSEVGVRFNEATETFVTATYPAGRDGC